MNKQLNKLAKRLGWKRGRSQKTSLPRITNETLAEDRESVISKGKRFKYPLQQTKKRTALLSSLIVLLLVAATVFFTWWQLYYAQSTSAFTYRVTQILPLPVGKVNGETVLYRDYLMDLRSSLHYLTTKEAVNLDSDSGERQLAYQKRQAMNKVLEQALIRQVARDRDISVSSDEVEQFVKEQIEANDGADKADFRAVIEEYYGWSLGQYRASIRDQLLKQKVVAAVDDDAHQLANQILSDLDGGAKFERQARKYSDDESTKQNGGDVGFVPLGNPGPAGLVRTAAELKKGQVSDVIEATEGLYIIKNLGKKGDRVRYARIFIQFDAFGERFAALREAGQVQEYIEIPEVPTAVTGAQ